MSKNLEKIFRKVPRTFTVMRTMYCDFCHDNVGKEVEYTLHIQAWQGTRWIAYYRPCYPHFQNVGDYRPGNEHNKADYNPDLIGHANLYDELLHLRMSYDIFMIGRTLVRGGL